MLGAAALAGLLAAWWLFPLGLAGWGVMVWRLAQDPSLRLQYALTRRAQLTPRFQAYFERIQRAQVGMFNTLAAAPRRARRALAPLQPHVDALAEQAYHLGQRMTALENHRLQAQVLVNQDQELTKLKQQLASASDPIAQREYEQARAAFDKRAASLAAVTHTLDRVEAQYASLTNELEGVQAQMIRLQALRGHELDESAGGLAQALRQQARDLAVFEKEIATL
jgi:chromosome segregation ATPase